MSRYAPWFLVVMTVLCVGGCDGGGDPPPRSDGAALDAGMNDARPREDGGPSMTDHTAPSRDADADARTTRDADAEPECSCDWTEQCEPDCECDRDCPTPPAGWTCPAYWLVNDYCDCGCGIPDAECTSFTIDDCLVPNGCADGTRPDPTDPARCIANPAGWTCNGLSYDSGGSCNCGCGIADPDCPSPLRWSACDYDGCASGGPSPIDPTQCVDDPPQDDWTCAAELLADGATCDCGCGARDPDCGADATVASCEATHCASSQELDPTNIDECQERCAPPTGTVGSATCTNGGEISIGSSCNLNLSRCTDGHRYEVECSGGECVCRVDSACVSRSTTGFCGGVASTLNSVCGWSLVDDR